VRQVERKEEIKMKEGPTVVAMMPRKQIARRTDRSEFWKIYRERWKGEKKTGEREARSFSRGETLRGRYCYDTVKGEVVIFFIYLSGFYIRFYFGFTFLYYIDNDNEEACDTVIT